ncbi:MAG: toll/interleukin-1 receptor domain-containing protein [Candidatus Marinimicrobia bacterium]|nr:toll/interleukin-1 receptor domain-containing protein [Candidatus Neomarinimicrobiota bacterium]
MKTSDDTIFISYSHEEEEFALRIAAECQSWGLKVNIDKYLIKPGDDLLKKLYALIPKSKYYIIILSPYSISSKNVIAERILAENSNLKIIPLIYKKCEIPESLLNISHIDFTKHSYKRCIELLLNTFDKGLSPIVEYLDINSVTLINNRIHDDLCNYKLFQISEVDKKVINEKGIEYYDNILQEHLQLKSLPMQINIPYHLFGSAAIFLFLKTILNYKITINYIRRTRENFDILSLNNNKFLSFALSETQFKKMRSNTDITSQPFDNYFVCKLPFYGDYELYMPKRIINYNMRIVTFGNSSQIASLLRATKEYNFLSDYNYQFVSKNPVRSEFYEALRSNVGVVSPYSFLFENGLENSSNYKNVKYKSDDVLLLSTIPKPFNQLLRKVIYSVWYHLANNSHEATSLVIDNIDFRGFSDVSGLKIQYGGII